MPKKTILFDYDGTLADTIPVIIKSISSTLGHFLDRTFTDDEIVSFFGPGEEQIVRSKLQDHTIDEAIPHFYDQYHKAHDNVEMPTALLAMLHHLTEAGYQLGIVTGKGLQCEDISSKIFGLTPFFSVKVIAEDVSGPKPSPEGLLKAMKRLGATPENTMYVGDSQVDMEAAKAAGIQFAGAHWFDTYHGGDQVDFSPYPMFTDPEEFKNWVIANWP